MVYKLVTTLEQGNVLVASLAERGQSRACSLQRKSLVLSRELTSAPSDAQMQQGCGQLASWGLAAGQAPICLRSGHNSRLKVFLSAQHNAVFAGTYKTPGSGDQECSVCSSPIKNMHKASSLGIKSLQKAASEGQGRGTVLV